MQCRSNKSARFDSQNYQDLENITWKLDQDINHLVMCQYSGNLRK